jgi:hypothetical protein
MPAAFISLRLRTPSLPCLVPAGVFDAFAWCESDFIEWRGPEALDLRTPVDGTNPARMVFVMRTECDFLPRELARLHAFGLGLDEEWALAPYAIDDATDELYARHVRPGDLLWLAAANLNALVWGLHDWAHFHNHGPFEERAWTELQCDAAALVWLRLNHAAIGLDERTWERARSEVHALSVARFTGENKPFPEGALSSGTLEAIATRLEPGRTA